MATTSAGRALRTGIANVAVFAALAAMCGERVETAREVSADGAIRIHSARGDLEVVGWDRPEISVVGDLDDLARELDFRVAGERALVRVDTPERNVVWGDGSDLVIRVPSQSRVMITTASADVQVKGVATAVIRSMSGDVRASAISGDIRVNTVSGDVELSGRPAAVRAVTVSGDLDLEVDAGDVTIDTISGEADVQLGDFERLVARSKSGRVNISGRLGPAGQISAETVAGDIELKLTAPVDARIDVRTGPGGGIDNELTDDAPREVFANRMELQCEAGAGGGRIVLRTVSGEVRLERE